jgi:hypothetical protein
MEAQISRWAAQVQAKKGRYDEFTRSLQEISASSTGSNGSIRVTVGPSGLVTNLELSEHTRSMPAAYLAEQILVTMRQAQVKLGPKVVALMEEKVGEDKVSISEVAASYDRQFPAAPTDVDAPAAGKQSEDDPTATFLRDLPGENGRP